MTFNFYATQVGKDLLEFDETKEYAVDQLKPKKYPKGSKVLICDGDILAYKLASVGDERACLVSRNGKTKEFKNKTTFKNLNKDKGFDFSTFTFQDILKPKPIEFCLQNLKNAIGNIKEKTGCTHVELYIGGSGNFRCPLPLPTEYKGGRKDTLRPTYLTDCKNYLVKYHGAIKIKGVEADDYVQQRMYELSLDNVDAILYTNDKDALQAYRHDITTYNPDKDEIKTFKGGVGGMWIQNDKHVKGSGLKWLLGQTLFGDNSDDYKGNELSVVNYGDKTYYKDTLKIDSIKELLEYSVGKWKTWYPDVIEYTAWDGVDHKKNWLEIAEMYWSCAYMRLSHNDPTTFESLLKEHNVEY